MIWIHLIFFINFPQMRWYLLKSLTEKQVDYVLDSFRLSCKTYPLQLPDVMYLCNTFLQEHIWSKNLHTVYYLSLIIKSINDRTGFVPSLTVEKHICKERYLLRVRDLMNSNAQFQFSIPSISVLIG